MNSTTGRPRTLTDAQVAEILAWHASRKTIRDVANDYGVTRTTIANLIRRGGQYKQASRERLPALRAERARQRAELEARGLM